MIAGIGPDAPVIVTSGGGKHAASPYAFELVPAVALFEVARTLASGARKYGADNWRGVPIADQLGHALQHVYGYLAGDISDDHLAHAACRILFALELDKTGPRGSVLIDGTAGTSGAGSSPAAGPFRPDLRGLGVTASTARAHDPESAGSIDESLTRAGSTPAPPTNFRSDEWRKDLDYLAPCLN